MLKIKNNLQSPLIFRSLQSSQGFTLIELMVVIVVIGIVSGIIMASVNNSKAKGRDARRIADISVIQLALERYYDVNKSYPNSLSVLDDSVPKKDSLGNNYLYQSLNADNKTVCSVSCQSYHLGTTLELSNNILNDDTVDANNIVGFDGTGLVYDVVPKF